jgi:hypothetical protein
MITVHPEFDPATQTWFAPGLEFEAPTLRALQREMGPQVTFPDYYPQGLGAAIALRHSWGEEKVGRVKRTMALEPMNRRRKPAVKAEKSPPAARPTRRKHDRDQLLDLWASGLTGAQIAERMGGGLTKAVAVSIVMIARRAGDPRAVRRFRKVHTG